MKGAGYAFSQGGSRACGFFEYRAVNGFEIMGLDSEFEVLM